MTRVFHENTKNQLHASVYSIRTYHAPRGKNYHYDNPCYHSDIALTDMISTQMNRSEIKKTLEALAENIASISDERVASVQKTLFNLVEVLVDANAQRDKIIQELKDEINRLKGEQGKPQFDKKKLIMLQITPHHRSTGEKDCCRMGELSRYLR